MDFAKIFRENAALIQSNLIENLSTFLLKYQGKIEKEKLNFIADQIQSRQKAKNKLPSWFAHENIIFPPPISVEQASSEISANYKANLISGKLLIDLTGGMGVDASFFAKHFESVIYVEKNENLVTLAKHNFGELGIKNTQFFQSDSVDFLQNNSFTNSTIYLDPARRDSSKNKVFLLEDCEPNLLIIKDLLFQKANKILVKTSPLLDINLATRQLENVSEIHVLAIENEVKELLFLLEKSSEKQPKIVAVNITKNGTQSFDFLIENEQNLVVNFSKPKQFIYEPNAAVLKAGAFKTVAVRFGLSKLAPNSHLYTSADLVENFVGRTFDCQAVCRFDKREILAKLPTNQANITVRNFPMSVEEIRKKLHLREGGDDYLFATEDAEKQKIMLICRKIA